MLKVLFLLSSNLLLMPKIYLTISCFFHFREPRLVPDSTNSRKHRKKRRKRKKKNKGGLLKNVVKLLKKKWGGGRKQ